MPMDIRNFFGQKAGKPGKSKSKKASSAANDTSSTTNSASARTSNRSESSAPPTQANKRKPIELDDSSTTDDDNKTPPKRKTAPDSKAKASTRKTVVIDDDSSTDDEKEAQDKMPPTEEPNKRKAVSQDSKEKASPAKKLKSDTGSAPKEKEEDRVEVSVDDFFSKSLPVKPTKPPPKKEVETLVDVEPRNDDEPLDRILSTEKSKEPKKQEDEEPLGNEAMDEEYCPSDEESKRQKRDAPSPHVDEEAEPSSVAANPSTNKRNKTPSSAQKKTTPRTRKSSTPKKKKEPPLQPTERLTSFSTDDAIPECLMGRTFVFTGVLPTISREAGQDFVKILGGRVTGSVSSKTDYLVVGELLEDGRAYTEGSKYRKAKELGVIIVKGEEELYGLAKLYSDKAGGGKQPSQDPATVSKDTTGLTTMSASAPSAAPPTNTRVPANPYAKRPAGATLNPYAKKAKPAASAATSNPYAGTTMNPYAAAKSAAIVTPQAPVKSDPNMLWADKYAPESIRDILGNQESVKKLVNWLARWEDTFNTHRAQGKTYSAPTGPWKAALLSGPPGIGKTTAALLVAKESGRDILELNASDVRSKKGLSQGLGDVTGSQVLNFETPSMSQKKRVPSKKRCIIMDEVDGMGAGDRSGMAELIKMIKVSKVPIICICNDRQSQKVRSLASYCMDLRFKRPVKTVIARRAVRIGQQEGMTIETNAAEAIAESCGNDIRQVLNCLQMWANKKGNNRSMTYKDVKERQGAINKDEILRVSMFDATKLIIEGRKGLVGAEPKAVKDSLYKRSDAFFVDYGLMGLNVHQNYPKVMVGQYNEAKRTGDDGIMLEFVERMHDATASMSDFAVAEQAVRGGDQNWGLLPLCGMLTVKTGYHAGGENGGFLAGFPEFAGWMGKNSTRGRKNRLLQELNHHMNYKVSGDSRELRLHYLPMLKDRFLSLMMDKDGAKTTEVIELMDDYGLDRDDVFENLDEFKLDSTAKSFSNLDSKQKAAFTREYNKRSHKSQALIAEQGAGKVSRKQKAPSEGADLADPDVVNDDVALESTEDDIDDESDADKIRELFKKKGGSKKAKTGKKRGSGKKKKKT